MLCQIAEGIPAEEPDGQPGRIGRKTQNVERMVGVQRKLRTGKPVGKLFHGIVQVVLRPFLRQIVAKERKVGKVRILGFCALGPADNGGVPDLVTVSLVCQQIVKRGGVGEGGVFPHRRVQALLLAIGAESRGVEGNHGRAAGFGTGYALDGGVDGHCRVQLAGDQTLLGFSVAAVIVPAPGGLDGGVIPGENSVYLESQIAALENFLETVGKRGMTLGVFRCPGVKIG